MKLCSTVLGYKSVLYCSRIMNLCTSVLGYEPLFHFAGLWTRVILSCDADLCSKSWDMNLCPPVLTYELCIIVLKNINICFIVLGYEPVFYCAVIWTPVLLCSDLNLCSSVPEYEPVVYGAGIWICILLCWDMNQCWDKKLCSIVLRYESCVLLG